MTTPTPDLIRVNINTEVETFPDLGICEAPLSRWAYEIPRSLWEALRDAQRALGDAEASIMRYVGERHPEAREVRAWVREYDGGDGS